MITVVFSSSASTKGDGKCEMNDLLDRFNRPRTRKNSILSALQSSQHLNHNKNLNVVMPSMTSSTMSNKDQTSYLINSYQSIHSIDMIEFLCQAWGEWKTLGQNRRDPACFHPAWHTENGNDEDSKIPPLVPQNFTLRSTSYPQRPSSNVMGKMGFYCTDLFTPIVSSLKGELVDDALVIETACVLLKEQPVVYALTSHPGHHASTSSFGGYCYLNNAALAASKLRKNGKVAVLDVDYHAGNGTLEIFAGRENFIVVSLHCDPNVEYPFHSGFEAEALGVQNFSLPPGTVWRGQYEIKLQEALKIIENFGPLDALVVSLGLDTFDNDPVAVPGAGFKLVMEDYFDMGKMIGAWSSNQNIPIMFVQEGGYMIDKVGNIIENIFHGFVSGRKV